MGLRFLAADPDVRVLIVQVQLIWLLKNQEVPVFDDHNYFMLGWQAPAFHSPRLGPSPRVPKARSCFDGIVHPS